MTRRESLYPEIKRLREVESLMWREIGERLGLSLKTVQDYYVDPTGVNAAARKTRSDEALKRPCPVCGSVMGVARNGAQRCRECYGTETKKARRARIEDVAEMFRKGMSQREIANELGYGPNSTPPEITYARQLGLIGYRYKGCEGRSAA